MKLIKQINLFFQEGTSDKVYQIDLLQVGDGYVVNFRYGRRGSALKEGTKTIFPVAISEAEKVFQSLEQEKRKKGYVAEGEKRLITAPAAAAPNKVAPPGKIVLKYLKAAVAGEAPENWPVSRIIWRAGELKIPEAIPALLKLADYDDPMNLYVVVWAIGRIKAEKGLAFLQTLQKQAQIPAYVHQLAEEVILDLSPETERNILIENLVAALPETLRLPLQNRNIAGLEIAIEDLLLKLKTAANEYLIWLYRLSRFNATARVAFLNILPNIPFEINYFHYIRRIFKTAEMLEDYEVYGLISKEIEKRDRNYSYGRFNPNQAFAKRTKGYLTRRIVRLLSRAGKDNSETYTSLATGLLVAFNDQTDLTEPFEEVQYRANYNQHTRSYTYETITLHYDQYARFQALNFILYTNSTRYQPAPGGWQCIAPYKPGQPAPDHREEAFPALWNQSPTQVINLLKKARATRVQAFALKVFKSNPPFENLVETADLFDLLQAPFTGTQALALELAQKRYNPAEPDKALLLALLQSNLTEAREQGFAWIEAAKYSLLADAGFLTDLLKIANPETHRWLRAFLAAGSLTSETADATLPEIIRWLITESSRTKTTASTGLVADTITIIFRDYLPNISLELVRELLQQETVALQEFAGKILLVHQVKPEALPEDLFLLLAGSENPAVRALGIQLLGKLPEHQLLTKKDVLASFCLSSTPEVREAVRPVIGRLNKAYPSFGHELVILFVPALLRPESYDGLHEDLFLLLSGELQDHLRLITLDKTLLLLNARYRPAQKLGSFVLLNLLRHEDIAMQDLVKLADNPLQEIRQFAWAAFEKNISKVKANKEVAIKIVDAEWADTRAWAYQFFRSQFYPEDWTPDLLVSICDSNQPDVQAFGKEMITRCFKAEDGTEYLLKLSQHPNTQIQLFTTTYLAAYAQDNLAALKVLQLYFITVLTGVNKGKAAKARVLEFLKQEGVKSEEAAGLVAGIFNRVSLSVGITEKAASLQALLAIKKAFPNVDTAVHMQDYPEYSRN